MIPLPRTVLTCGKCPGRFAKWRGLPCDAWGCSGCPQASRLPEGGPWIKAGPLNQELEPKLAETGAERGWVLLCCQPRALSAAKDEGGAGTSGEVTPNRQQGWGLSCWPCHGRVPPAPPRARGRLPVGLRWCPEVQVSGTGGRSHGSLQWGRGTWGATHLHTSARSSGSIMTKH